MRLRQYAQIFLFCAIYAAVLMRCSSGQKESIPAPVPEQVQGPAYLGILYMETLDGLVISEVYPGSPAEKAGLKRYDLILSANGYPVIGPYTLKERILSLKPGTSVEIEILSREGGRTLRHAVLEPMPERFLKQGGRF